MPRPVGRRRPTWGSAEDPGSIAGPFHPESRDDRAHGEQRKETPARIKTKRVASLKHPEAKN
jgi:hypothetical protein